MKKGFFSIPEKKTKPKKTAKPKLYDCSLTCPSRNECNSPDLPVVGEGAKKILIIDNYPTQQEDRSGNQLMGLNSKYLKAKLREEGISFKRDCWAVKAVRCRPKMKKGKPILPAPVVSTCKAKLMKTIEKLKPEKILVLGDMALISLIGHRCNGRLSATDVEKWQGWVIPDQELGCYVYPTYHPSNLVDKFTQKRDQIKSGEFGKQIANLADEREFRKEDYKSRCGVVLDVKEATELLKVLQKEKCLGWDTETTGIKPHKAGHEIVCFSFSNGIVSYGMPNFQDFQFQRELRRLLRLRRVKKYGWNMKFEETWSRETLNYAVGGWEFDGMLGTHMLDQRSGISSLKMQTYVHLGILGYDNAIDHYLKGIDKKDSNSFNRIKDAPIEEVCMYCAEDALYTFILCARIQAQVKRSRALSKGYELFHTASLNFADIEGHGMAMDNQNMLEVFQALTAEMNYIHKQIMSGKEAKLWDGEKEFNFNSSKQLQHLLFDLLGFTPKKFTDTDQPSTDNKALEKINTKFVQNILEYKKLKKIRDTYLAGFQRETIDGIMHPGFNLHTVASYRTSSNNPNFQNLSKRNKKASKAIKSNIKPRKGHRIVEIDYSSLEVRIAACYNKDENLIAYILDPASCMHYDQASIIFKKDRSDITKDERGIAKNMWVFPLFYGSYYKNCAMDIWEKIDKATRRHLRKKGIKSYQAFEAHLKVAEDIFWNDRFFGYAKWKNTYWKKFLRKGYIDSLTGFKYSGNLDKKQACNYPVQGSGSHVLIWSLNKIHKYLKDGDYNTTIIGQVHDSIVFDFDPAEWEELYPIINRIMTLDVREHWPWIVVPLKVEADLYDIDGNWFDIKKENEGVALCA